MTSYGAFHTDADCADTRADGYPGLDPGKIELLAARNDRLNAVLTAGAEKYGFPVARPELGRLCDAGERRAGPGPAGARRPVPVPPDRDRVAAHGVVGGPAGPAARLPLTPPPRARYAVPRGKRAPRGRGAPPGPAWSTGVSTSTSAPR